MICCKFSLTLIFALLCESVKAANILALLGVPSPSHFIWNEVLINGLAARGHNVTVLSGDIPKNPKNIPKNVHYIHLERIYAVLYESEHDENLNITDYIGIGVIEGIPMFYDFALMSAAGSYKSKGMQILLEYPNDYKFDLVIHDYSSGPHLLGYLHKFNYPPLVGIAPFLNPPCTVDAVGGHFYPAYVPFHATNYDVDMNFFERAYNTLAYVVDTLYRRYIFISHLNKLAKEIFGKDVPNLEELEQRTVLALVNAHFSIHYPEPLPPNVVEVGGLQLVEAKPIPEDLRIFIEKSKKGAIFFSLGTNMKAKDIEPKRIQIFIEVMKQMPDYHFLWKFDVDVENLPKNVLIRPFFPQRDILGHPKIKAFVSHAGGLSTQETIYHGVPIVGIALFIDQIRNIQKAMLTGIGERVHYLNITVESLRGTIEKVLYTPSYKENIKALSSRFKDRPMKPLDTAIWWIEYVLRNSELKYFQSPTLSLGFWISNSYDIMFSILLAFALIILSCYKALGCCFNQNKSRTKTLRDKKNK